MKVFDIFVCGFVLFALVSLDFIKCFSPGLAADAGFVGYGFGKRSADARFEWT